MATVNNVPTLGFGVTVAAVVMLGFSSAAVIHGPSREITPIGCWNAHTGTENEIALNETGQP